MQKSKHEFIDWKEHPNLNNVTKLCISYFENQYSFDHYLDDRSMKDNKFVNPLEDKSQDSEAEGDKESEFSISGEEDEEMSQNGEESTTWERGIAEKLYKRTRDELESKYFIA